MTQRSSVITVALVAGAILAALAFRPTVRADPAHMAVSETGEPSAPLDTEFSISGTGASMVLFTNNADVPLNVSLFCQGSGGNLELTGGDGTRPGTKRIVGFPELFASTIGVPGGQTLKAGIQGSAGGTWTVKIVGLSK